MRTRFDCLLDGVSLSQLDERLCVLDICEAPPEERWQTARPARRSGMVVTDRHRGALRVKVRFGIRERAVEARALIMERAQAWSRGHKLQVSARPGRYVNVVCTSLPQTGSALQWTDTLEMTFTAWDVPYWQDMTKSRAALTQENAQGTLYVPGTAERAPVCAQVKNTSSQSCDSVTITCGETGMALTGLALAQGETLRADYDEADTLRLFIQGAGGNTRSVMASRTPDSDDDLLAACGSRSPIAIAGPASFEASFEARGRWL